MIGSVGDSIMKKVFKWFGIIIGAMVVLIVVAILVVPMFVDVQKYRPLIEEKVEEATGRPFEMGGDLELSLFPWAGVTMKDVSLGNPEGFETGNFAEFSEFEVRVKVLPLLSGDVQVKHIVLKGLKLVLEKDKSGKVNWEFAPPVEAVKEAAPEKEKQKEVAVSESDEALPIKTLAVGEISVTDGSVLYIDHQSDVRKELSDVNIRLENISFDTPVEFSLSGKLDNKPFSLEGNVGPVGKKPGEGDIDLDLTAKAFDILELRLNGQVTDPATALSYRMHLAVNQFSPKRLIKEVAPEVELSSADPAVLEKLGLEVDLSGDAEQVALSNGKLVLDDTTTTFQVTAKEFSKPDVALQLHMDTLDVDRYLPESKSDEPTAGKGGNAGGTSTGGSGGSASPEAAEIDYTPLRSLVVDGNIEVDELSAGGGTVRDIVMKVSGAGGKIKIEPLSMNLYEGSLLVKSLVDVTGKKPKTAVDVTVDGLEIEPLLKDFLEKDFITGTTQAQISISMKGDTPEQIKKTLNGNGNLQFMDGKIRNVNLLGMIQNLQAAFGSGTATDTQETDFSEFESKFTITNGVVNTSGTTVSSPVLRVEVTGSADLVNEGLDFRVNPTYINPKNQREAGLSISGNQVPVLVSGTFSDPKFKPDLETAAKKVVTEKITEKLGEVLGESLSGKSKDGSGEEDEQPSTVEDSVKGILKNLPFGK